MKKRAIFITLGFAVALTANAQIRVSNNGYVGIGGITPTEPLHVFREATTNGNNVIANFERRSASTGGSGIVRLNVGASVAELQVNSGYSDVNQEYGGYFDFNIVNKSPNPDYSFINFITNNRIVAQITPNGYLKVRNIEGNLIYVNTTWTSSDIRLKRNIVDLRDGINTVMQLRPVSYDKKITIKETEYNNHEFGFIAQELQKTLPTLVSEGSDKDKILSVNYFAIIPILTKAIQEQQNSIISLQSQIDDLNKKIESLIEK
jgi:hypothetical protein